MKRVSLVLPRTRQICTCPRGGHVPQNDAATKLYLAGGFWIGVPIVALTAGPVPAFLFWPENMTTLEFL